MLLAAEGTMLLLITELIAEIAQGCAKVIVVAPPFLFHFWGIPPRGFMHIQDKFMRRGNKGDHDDDADE